MKIKVLSLAITLMVSAPLTLAQTELRIDNPGFENGLNDWIDTDSSASAVSSSSFSGSQSLKLSGSPGRVSQFVDLDRNTDYELQARVRGEGQIFINSHDDGPGFVSMRFDHKDWTLVRLMFNSGDARETEFGAKYRVEEDVRFDDFKLFDRSSNTPTPTPPSIRDSGTPTPTPRGRAIPDIITDGDTYDLEGDPNPLVNSNTLRFVPLETKFTTPNGTGWRHEYKIKQSRRIRLSDTYEVFEADVRVDMSRGSKTIIAQHHASGLGTISKVFIADSNESGFDDSRANNGVFDVYARLRNTDGDEEKFALGTIRSGESFNLRVINNYGDIEVSALGRTYGMTVDDDSESFFKFGNYLQSQNPVGSVRCGDRGDTRDFERCYDDLDITESVITMTNVSYERIEDD